MASKLFTFTFTFYTQNVTTRRRCGRNDNQDSPRELPAHRANGTAADQSESKVSEAARRGGGGRRKWLGGGGRAGGGRPRSSSDRRGRGEGPHGVS